MISQSKLRPLLFSSWLLKLIWISHSLSKVEILFLRKWSNRFPQFPWLLNLDRLTNFENVVQCLLNVSFQSLLNPHITTPLNCTCPIKISNHLTLLTISLPVVALIASVLDEGAFPTPLIFETQTWSYSYIIHHNFTHSEQWFCHLALAKAPCNQR